MTLSLNDLVARAKARSAAEAEAKASEKTAKAFAETAKRRPLTAEELELRERADWEPTALVLVFDAWECACGASGDSPGGLMIHSRHRRMSADRLLAPRFESQVDPTLPRHFHYETRVVALCPHCAESNGFLTKHTPMRPQQEIRPADFTGEGAGFVREWQQLRAQPEGDPT